ncbi:MAG: hypothetical protein AAGC67_03120 [Myxococcota bacterium]
MATAERRPSNRLVTALGWVLIALGLAVFVVRLQHEGAYAVPRRGNLFGGLGALGVGVLLAATATPSVLRWIALALTPFVLFSGTYAISSELEEVVSLYATDRAGRPSELRLWIVDDANGEWLGMGRDKAVEHALDGVPIQMLRRGETRCVVPVLFEDRPTVEAMHALKMQKYAVARIASSFGAYPATPRPTGVALRLDACPGGA